MEDWAFSIPNEIPAMRESRALSIPHSRPVVMEDYGFSIRHAIPAVRESRALSIPHSRPAAMEFRAFSISNPKPFTRRVRALSTNYSNLVVRKLFDTSSNVPKPVESDDWVRAARRGAAKPADVVRIKPKEVQIETHPTTSDETTQVSRKVN